MGRACRSSLLPTLLASVSMAAGAPADPLEPLEVHPENSSDGVYQLSWRASGDVAIEESRDASFEDWRVVYGGSDQATTLTGRVDGSYFYRLRSLDDDVVDTRIASVTVEHHSLPRALAFFVVGLGVFAATVALVLRGAESDGGRDG